METLVFKYELIWQITVAYTKLIAAELGNLENTVDVCM